MKNVKASTYFAIASILMTILGVISLLTNGFSSKSILTCVTALLFGSAWVNFSNYEKNKELEEKNLKEQKEKL